MRRRSFLLISLIVLLATAAGGFLAFRISTTSIRGTALANLKALYNVAISRYYSQMEPQQASRAIAEEAGVRATVIASDGSVIADSDFDPSAMENHFSRSEIQQAARLGTGWALRHSDTAGSDTLYYAAQLEDGSILRLSVTLMTARAAAGNETGLIAIVVGLLAASGILAAYLASKGINNKLDRMARLSRRLAEGDFSVRLSEGGDGSEARLASSFNLMADRLSSTVRGLTRQKAELAGVLASVAEGILAVDSDLRITLINEKATKLLGAEGATVQGARLLEAIRAPKLEKQLRGAIETGEDRYFEEARQTGEAIAVAVAPIIAEGMKAVGAVASIRDISGARKLEKMRSEFVANVTHELKTPLTSIRGFAESLSSEDDHELRMKFLYVIISESDRMSRLIDDIIALSQIETMGVGRGPSDLGLEAKAAAEALSAGASTKGVSISIEADEGVLVDADSTTSRRLAVNLLDNAVKYTSLNHADGGGLVIVRVKASDGRAVLEVEDNGVGIAAEHQLRVFERFYRVDTSRSRQMGGTGLGLAIVKHIAISMGGSAKVASKPGVGSTFTVAVPLAKAQKA